MKLVAITKAAPPHVGAAPNGARPWTVRSLVALGALAWGSGACGGGEVVRVHDGVEVRGRFISDVAYAAYARGAEHEARGHDSASLDAYLAAAQSDPSSVEVWTRIGAVRCRLERHAAAAEAFARAEGNDPGYEPLWRERAICAEAGGDEAAAVEGAARAVALDPDRHETVLLYARLLETQGETKRAGRWLHALAVSSPHEVSVWQAVHDHALRGKDERWARHAAARLRRLGERLSPSRPASTDPTPWDRVDEALQASDLATARRLARQARFHPSLLAMRAIVVGRADLALEEAELRVDAEPTDSDSRITLALAADLTGQRERTSRRLGALPPTAAPATELGALMLGELLLRHLGPKAAQAWLGGPVVAAGEGTAALRQRLRDKLQSEGGQR